MVKTHPMSQVILVTGAGSGIGQAVALAFLKRGDTVVLAGRRRPALEETAAMSQAGARAIVAPADVADPDQIAKLFEGPVASCGRLDVLFNNAGRGAPPVPFEDLPLDAWRATVDVNLTGSFLCAQHAVRQMKRQDPQGGRIINNGSISAHSPRPNSAAYTATKHAITGLTKSTILDGRPFDITAAQVDIGNAATEMTQRMTQGVLQPDGKLAVEPRMDVDHVGEQVAFMAELPLESNVAFVTIMATKMPLYGRG